MLCCDKTVQLGVPSNSILARLPIPAVLCRHAGADEMRDMGISFRQHWPQKSTQDILSSVYVHATAVSPVLQTFMAQILPAFFLWQPRQHLTS